MELISLLQSEATQNQYIFNFVLINIIFILSYKFRRRKKTTPIIWLLILVFCLFAYWDTDYFSFREEFYTSLKDFRDPLYYYISQISLNSYSLFRFIIWGAALYLFNRTIKEFNVHNNTALFIFAISCLPLFAQMRGSLGLASYCFGLSLLIMNKSRSIPIILGGILFIVLSYFGHRSMIVPIVLTPLILLKPNKLLILLFIIIGISVGGVASTVLSDITTGDLTLDANPVLSGAEEGLVKYASKEVVVTYNWKYTLTTELRRHTYTVLFVYCLWMCFFSKKRDEIPDFSKKIMLVCCGLFAIGISIFMVGSLGATLMGERFLFYLGPPLCIVLTSIRQKGLCKSIMFYIVLMPGFLFVELFIFGKILSF